MPKYDLKILPEYFNAVLRGDKTFEIRKNDRNFQWGDTIQLSEYDAENDSYTGRSLICEVTYILYGNKSTEKYGLKEGYCIMSIALKW